MKITHLVLFIVTFSFLGLSAIALGTPKSNNPTNVPPGELKLRQGDVLTEVQSKPLNSKESGLEAFQELNQSPKANAKVIRDGEEEDLSEK